MLRPQQAHSPQMQARMRMHLLQACWQGPPKTVQPALSLQRDALPQQEQQQASPMRRRTKTRHR